MAEETKIIRIIVDSSKAVDGSAAATRALEKLERSTASMDTALARMERGLGGIGTLIKANLALALADVAARMIQMAKGAFDAAAGMDELAEQLGVTAKGLQGLQFSAVQNGIKLEQLETGVAKFSQKMGEAAGGSKEMIEALDRIGVKVLDVGGRLRPTETLLQEVAASISAIDDPARRAAAAVDFFGKAGTRMLPMLKDMSGGMEDMAARAKAAGAFIEADTVAKLDKLTRDTAREFAAGTAYAEASERGARAVADLETHFKALKSAQDAYGKTADANKEGLARLTAEIEKQVAATEKLKNLSAFNLATEALEKQNVILDAENRLINATVEDRTREIALIKLRQEIEAKGLDANDPREREAIARRGEAITQNERLKAQGEELRKANELWTEPLKSALQSIQSTAADMFDTMLEKGTFSFEEIGKVVRRMVAEFAALAVIRPMLGSVVGGLSAIGLVSPATAASLGYGSTGGSGGGFSMPSFGGFGSGITSSLGSFGEWLNTPFTGAYAGMSPSSMAGVPTIGGSAATGVAGTGITPLGAFGAAAGAGMGIYQLATARNTAQTIGGIGTMIGAGVSLIPGMAPIGMGISLLSSILPGLFGGESAPIPPLSGANTRFDPGASGYVQSGSRQNGGGSINGQFAGIGSTLDAFFNAAGGLTNPGNAFGAAVWNNQREGTTSTYLLSPTQGSNQQTYNESGDPAKAIDRLIAKAFYNTIQNNAAMNASPTLRTAFSNREPTSTAQISGLFDLIQVYDQLGKSDNITAAERALKEIDASFASLSAGAREWGLSMAPITDEISKQRKAYAEDFLHTIDSVLEPVGTALDDFAKEREAGMKEWAYINDNVKEIVIAQAKVEEYYAKKEAALKEQLYGGAVSQLEDAIKRLMPGGSLSNLDPVGTLAGLRASYSATYAQAQANDPGAIARLAGEGIARADFERAYFAGSPEYNATRDEILANFQTIQAAIQSPTGSSTPLNTNDPGIQTLVQQNQILQQTVQTLVENDKRKSEEVTRLTNLLSRYLTNGQRAA